MRRRHPRPDPLRDPGLFNPAALELRPGVGGDPRWRRELTPAQRVLLLGNAPVTSWWLAGGISPANVAAAYQPKGAASLAASKVNLNNPGTNDATGASPPSWSEAGWAFNGNQGLDTGVHADSTYSMFVQFTGGVAVLGPLVGISVSGEGTEFAIWPNENSNVEYDSGNFVEIAPGLTAGNLGVGGTKGWRNGAVDTTVLPATYANPGNVTAVLGSVLASHAWTGTITAFALYNTVLSNSQAAAVAAAMAAL